MDLGDLTPHQPASSLAALTQARRTPTEYVHAMLLAWRGNYPEADYPDFYWFLNLKLFGKTILVTSQKFALFMVPLLKQA